MNVQRSSWDTRRHIERDLQAFPLVVS